MISMTMEDRPVTADTLALAVHDLHCAYGKTEAVRGLNLAVPRGRCFGLFGRNGAGKSTTIKCLLNLLRPQSGRVEVGGINPREDEVAVKRLIGYVPEHVSFHPWMTVAQVLNYQAAFRPHWNRDIQDDLLSRFDLEAGKKVNAMSKGMRSQLALICAVCPEPELLLLDEPTSGLDPIIRREFLQTVIGAYLEGAPGERTVLVSTHLINEWEGLIDEFAIVDKGRLQLARETEAARQSCRRIFARWDGAHPELPATLGKPVPSRTPDSVTLLTTDYQSDTEETLRNLGAAHVEIEPLNLEEIFVATVSLAAWEKKS